MSVYLKLNRREFEYDLRRIICDFYELDKSERR